MTASFKPTFQFLEQSLQRVFTLAKRGKINRVFLVHDIKGASSQICQQIDGVWAPQLRQHGASLEIVRVNEHETAMRWKPGLQRALEYQGTRNVLCFPGDIKNAPPDLDDRVQQMLGLIAGDDTDLVVGDFDSGDEFKQAFGEKYVFDFVEQLLGRQSPAVGIIGSLVMPRSEFWVARGKWLAGVIDSVLWTPDPTLLLLLTVDPNRVHQVKLGRVGDDPSTRTGLPAQAWQVGRVFAGLLNFVLHQGKIGGTTDKLVLERAANSLKWAAAELERLAATG